MKYDLVELKDTKMRCAFCGSKDEIEPKLSQKIECKQCDTEHYLELYLCKCGEHFYLYQTVDLLKQRYVDKHREKK